jgi:succinoglycan biosynthesis transport protein ExoP
MELTFLLRALTRRKWIIVISVAVALVTAYLLTIGMKNQYKSTAQMATGFTVAQELRLSNENFNLPQIEVKFNNLTENLTSPQVLSMVAYRLMLHDLQFPQAAFAQLDKKSKLPPIDRQTAIFLLTSHLDSMTMLSPNVGAEKALIDQLDGRGYNVESMTDNLKAERSLKTDYMDIAYTSGNAVLSAFVANTVCDEFRRWYGHNEQQRVDKSMVELDSAVNAKKAILDSKTNAKEAFMSANGVVDVGLEGSNKLAQISTYENQLIEERGIAKNASYRVEQLDKLINTAQNNGLSAIEAPSNITNGTASGATPASDNSEYIRMRKQYNDLYTEYMQKGGTDPAMKKKLDDLSQKMAQQNIVETEEAQAANGNPNVVSVNDLVQRKIDAQASLESANQKIGSITAALSQLQGGYSGMASKGVNLQEYDKEIQLATADYSAAKEQLNAAINSQQSSAGFRQTLVAVPASVPEKSKRPLILVSAVVGTLFLSSFVIILVAFFDRSIRSAAQFHALTDLPLLGMVPRIRLNGQENVLDRIAAFDNEEKHRDNSFLELLRKLRYELEVSNKRVILFTSTEPQQGKTVLIQALAYILSLGKKSVLIIDTNFCNNDLTINTNASPVLEKFDPGSGGFDKREVSKLVSRTSVERVGVIGCAGGDYTPSEILPKNHLLRYLDQMKDEYDFIFMEGAPLNEYTDTMELINYADGMVAVFAADANFTNLDKESIEFLELHKDKFIGAILNRVEEAHLDL